MRCKHKYKLSRGMNNPKWSTYTFQCFIDGCGQYVEISKDWFWSLKGK